MGKTSGTRNGTGRTEQATCVLESYLQATGISHTPLPDGGIAVETTAGDHLHVVFSSSTEAPKSSGIPTLSVSPDEVLAPEKNQTLSIFHEITERAGHGKPVPMDRGPEPVGVVSDFFLVSIRHRDFRRVPNPSDAELKSHEKLIGDVCRAFYRRFSWLCAKKGLGVEDLTSYAMVWTSIYLGRYKRTRRARDENERLLRRHLEQRLFGEFSLRLQRDMRIDNIDVETYQIATTGDVEGQASDDAPARASELDLSSADARKKSARDLLKTKLAELPHDSLVAMLSEAAANMALCSDARSEAKRRLTLHRKKCGMCSQGEAVSTPAPLRIEVDEDVPCADAGSVEE